MDNHEKARKVAAGYLSGKLYTCRELFDRLHRKGFEKETCAAVVEEFLQAGYLNDRQYTALYVEDAIRLGAKGAFRIRQELIKKGISSSLIEEALKETDLNPEAYLDEYIESHNLCAMVHSYRDLEKLKARLARRGYSLSEIRRCLEKYDFSFDMQQKEFLD